MSDYLWRELLWHIAAFGHAAVALPVAAILCVWLCAHARWSTSLWCAFAVLSCSAITLFLKLAFFSGDLGPVAGLENPSGHSAVGAVVYGSLAWIVSREMADWRRRILLLLTSAGVVAIGASLYAMGAHTLPDVLAGLALGGAFAIAFTRLAGGEDPPKGASRARLLLVVAIAAASLQGLPLATGFEPPGPVLVQLSGRL